jgi:hypothetical protein
MRRRDFVRDAALLGAAAGAVPRALHGAEEDVTARRIPGWRGFNLRGRFGWPGHPYDGPAFEESDFVTMKE